MNLVVLHVVIYCVASDLITSALKPKESEITM